MHEVSLCKNIIELIEQKVQGESCQKVTKIIIEVGELSCVEDSALQFSFEVIAQNSIAQDAQLVIEKIPAKAFCNSCENYIMIKSLYESCAKCGNYLSEVLEGRDIILKEVEIA